MCSLLWLIFSHDVFDFWVLHVHLHVLLLFTSSGTSSCLFLSLEIDTLLKLYWNTGLTGYLGYLHWSWRFRVHWSWRFWVHWSWRFLGSFPGRENDDTKDNHHSMFRHTQFFWCWNLMQWLSVFLTVCSFSFVSSLKDVLVTVVKFSKSELMAYVASLLP